MRIFIFTLMLAFSAPVLISGQSHAINQFYRTHKKAENVRNVKLPGFLIRMGSNIAKKHADDPIGHEALGMAKQIKKMRLMVTEDGGAIPAVEISQFISDLEKKDDFSPLISIRSSGQNVHIMMEEKKDILKSLLILVDSEDAFLMLSMKTKLKLEDIVDLVNMAISGDWEMEEVDVEDDEVVIPPKA